MHNEAPTPLLISNLRPSRSTYTAPPDTSELGSPWLQDGPRCRWRVRRRPPYWRWTLACWLLCTSCRRSAPLWASLWDRMERSTPRHHRYRTAFSCLAQTSPLKYIISSEFCWWNLMWQDREMTHCTLQPHCSTCPDFRPLRRQTEALEAHQ